MGQAGDCRGRGVGAYHWVLNEFQEHAERNLLLRAQFLCSGGCQIVGIGITDRLSHEKFVGQLAQCLDASILSHAIRQQCVGDVDYLRNSDKRFLLLLRQVKQEFDDMRNNQVTVPANQNSINLNFSDSFRSGTYLTVPVSIISSNFKMNSMKTLFESSKQ